MIEKSQTPRQMEIIEAALNLISNEGIQSLTIKNLSKQIGITEPAIYRHFENKIQILITILNLFKEKSQSLFESEFYKTDTAINKIDHLMSSHLQAFIAKPSLINVIFSEEVFKNEKVLLDKINEVITHNYGILTEIIIDGQEKKLIREDISASILATIIMGSLRLFIKQWQFNLHKDLLEIEGAKFIHAVKLLIRNSQ